MCSYRIGTNFATPIIARIESAHQRNEENVPKPNRDN